MMGRFVHVDIARGLAILYIIQCHVCDYHVAWIDSWALPVFFLIMGLFFKPTATWKEMIVKKARTILLPFFLLSIPSYIQYAIQLGLSGLIRRIADPFNCCHGVGWFLICMFWCYLIYYAIHRIAKGNLLIKFVICLALSVFFFYLSTWRPSFLNGHRMVMPYFLSTSFTCIVLVSAGELLRSPLLKERQLSHKYLIIGTLLGLLLIYLFGCKGGSMIVNDYYGQTYILWIANSILGSVSIVEICKYLPSFMAFWGKHSLLMLMVHPYVKRLVLLFFEPSIWLFLFIVAITTLLVYLLSEYLPITEGKFNNS